jgi:anti-anti-sigma factor
LPATWEESESRNVIRLQGVVDIACAADLKKLLVDALGTGREVAVSLDGVTDLDVTAVQLLWAAARHAEATGVRFSLEGQLSQPVAASLAEAGLSAFPAPAAER